VRVYYEPGVAPEGHVLGVRDRLQGVEFDAGGGFLASAPRWWMLPGARRR
jgi:hypothetical protein